MARQTRSPPIPSGARSDKSSIICPPIHVTKESDALGLRKGRPQGHEQLLAGLKPKDAAAKALQRGIEISFEFGRLRKVRLLSPVLCASRAWRAVQGAVEGEGCQRQGSASADRGNASLPFARMLHRGEHRDEILASACRQCGRFQRKGRGPKRFVFQHQLKHVCDHKDFVHQRQEDCQSVLLHAEIPVCGTLRLSPAQGSVWPEDQMNRRCPLDNWRL